MQSFANDHDHSMLGSSGAYTDLGVSMENLSGMLHIVLSCWLCMIISDLSSMANTDAIGAIQ